MEEIMRWKKSVLNERFRRIAQILFLAVLAIICSVSADHYFSSEKNKSNESELNKSELLEESPYKYYTSIEIKAGDSLWGIASEYMTEDYENIQDYVEEIKSLNRLASDKIHEGKYLVIPYYSR